MKQELLKYLCMALPYGVICKCYHTEFDEWAGTPFVAKYNDTLESIDVNGAFLVGGFSYEIDEIKPYLRPMSSMTEEEQKEFDEFCIIDEDAWDGNGIKGYINQSEIMQNGINWLLKKHFDFMGLIPKGLAIEVTKDDNPYE